MSHRYAAPFPGLARGLALILTVLAPASVRAQFREVPPPAAWALSNVTIVQADGTRSTGQTIVVRSGRIEALGTSVRPPSDARVLPGESLYVYPGLVDGAGAVDFEFPSAEVDRSQVRSWDPPREVQGFMPSRRVLDFLEATGAKTRDLRRNGVVAVAAHPPLSAPLMPGRGALLLLRPDADTPRQLVLDPELAPLMSLRGVRGVYPSTLMGVLAWYRQTFLDAERHAQLTRLASAQPGAVAAPGHDPDLAVLQQVLGSRGRIFFVANQADDIRRVLRLAEEFEFRPVIVGGTEAWKVAAELRSADVPVLVSLDFPESRRWKPDTKPDAEDDPQEPAPAAVREKQRLEDAYANAGRLAAAGVRFALVSGGEADLREGARRAIEYGLSEGDALRALTATPAALYGHADLGRVGRGLPATFVVTDAPLFGEDARVIYTFVNGVLERGADLNETDDSPEPGAGAPQDGAR